MTTLNRIQYSPGFTPCTICRIMKENENLFRPPAPFNKPRGKWCYECAIEQCQYRRVNIDHVEPSYWERKNTRTTSGKLSFPI